VKDKDFERFMGRQIEISLYKAMDGKKLIEGELTGYKDGTVTVKTAEGTELSVPREAAGKINLAVIF
ncbi:MAG: ribosome maturation factor RimP, partial [Firmicutes bacterium]|nr:ribosome maturation factor RimP [Bacillota bacterium]